MSDPANMIDVLYNSDYGGYSVSKKAIKLYIKKMLEINPNYVFNGKCISIANECDETCVGICDTSRYYYIKRHDPVLVEVFKELGNSFNESYSTIKIWKIPKKYENYYSISEYDGNEHIWIEYEKYKLDKIKNIIDGLGVKDTDSHAKIGEIGKVLLEENESIYNYNY